VQRLAIGGRRHDARCINPMAEQSEMLARAGSKVAWLKSDSLTHKG